MIGLRLSMMAGGLGLAEYTAVNIFDEHELYICLSPWFDMIVI